MPDKHRSSSSGLYAHPARLPNRSRARVRMKGAVDSDDQRQDSASPEIEDELHFARIVYATTGMLTRMLSAESALSMLLENGLSAIDHHHGCITMFAGHTVRISAMHGYTPEQVDRSRQLVIPPQLPLF